MTAEPMMQRVEAQVQALMALIEREGMPGALLGISGTDSVLAAWMMAQAFARLGRGDRVWGVHFGQAAPDETDPGVQARLRLSPQYRWVSRTVLPWLQTQCPEARWGVHDSPDTKDDPGRWAMLARWALANQDPTQPFRAGVGHWLVGTRNATEQALGSYSNLSSAVSVQPLLRWWKSDVLAACQALGVPAVALAQSRQVDCDCGRFDLAAQHIEAIDALLQAQQDPMGQWPQKKAMDPALCTALMAFIEEQQRYAAFKNRIPYGVP